MFKPRSLSVATKGGARVTMVKLCKFVCITLLLNILVLVTDQASAETIPQESTNECLFPNISTMSTTICSQNESRLLLPRMMACLSYLDEEDAAPSAKCCAGVRNVSTLSPPCLCRQVLYPGLMANPTRGRLMPGLCNITSDLCRVCSAFLVSEEVPHHSLVESEENISSYKKKVLGLAVVLGFAMACVMVGIALLICRRLKQRQALPPVLVTSNFQSKQPGCDY